MVAQDVDINGNAVGRGFNLNNLNQGWVQYPWIRRAVNSYADRMRVDNFSPAGNVMFQEMLKKALLGSPVFFIMQPNGRESTVTEEKVPIAQSSGRGADSTAKAFDNDTLQSGSDGQGDGQQYNIIRHIQSGLDPIDIDCIQDRNKYKTDGVCYVGYNGECYDNTGKKLDDIFCLYLSTPPITQEAVNIALGAQRFDDLTLAAMRDITVPQPYISGVDSDVQVRSKGNEAGAGGEQKAKDPNDRRVDAMLVPHPNDTNSKSITPSVGILTQWDSQKMFAYQQSKAIEFIGETKVPPVDFPETNALGQTAQALVSNREPFVSRVATIKAQVESVFNTARIPELSWQLLFPYTPQDIASIGDAAGKGVTAGTLKNYGSGLA